MPTSRPRHLVTESDELTAVLDAERARYPDLSRAQLIARLVLDAHAEREAALEARRTARRAAVRRYAGSLPGVYGPNYLEELRQDWPE